MKIFLYCTLIVYVMFVFITFNPLLILEWDASGRGAFFFLFVSVVFCGMYNLWKLDNGI